MRCAVIGAGNAGQVLAAYLKRKECNVRLYNRTQTVVDNLKKLGFITLCGEYEGRYAIDVISSDVSEVIEGAEVIYVTVPADAHKSVMEKMLPFLENGQIIVLMPGRLGGTAEMEQLLKNNDIKKDIVLAETDTLIFTCREIETGVCNIFAEKEQLKIAVHNSKDKAVVQEKVIPYFGNLVFAKSVKETGLSNIGMLFHPTPFLMNLVRVENHMPFLFYKEGITPVVASLIEKIDDERLQVARVLNVEVVDVKQWLINTYKARGENLYELIQSVDAYNDVYAPLQMKSRYVYEDIRTGLVPLILLGESLGIELPTARSIVRLAEVIYEEDFFLTGRNNESVDWKEFIS